MPWRRRPWRPRTDDAPPRKPTPRRLDAKKADPKKDAKKDAKKPDAKSKAAAKPATHGPGRGVAARPAPKAAPLTLAPTAAIATGELGELRNAVIAAKAGRGTEALQMARQLEDPVARNLVVWLVIRNAPERLRLHQHRRLPAREAGLADARTLRRRAERVLLAENKDPATVRAFFSEQDRSPARARLRSPVRWPPPATATRPPPSSATPGANDDLTENTENQVLGEFGVLLTRADHKARADRYSYKPDQAVRCAPPPAPARTWSC